VFNDSIQRGLEGIVAKRPDSPYQAGARNYNWVKLKRAQAGNLEDTVDCVIVGYIYGRGGGPRSVLAHSSWPPTTPSATSFRPSPRSEPA
jgi:DNA ligase-1